MRRHICIIRENEDSAKIATDKKQVGNTWEDRTHTTNLEPGGWQAEPLLGTRSHTSGAIYNHYGNITEKWGNRRYEGEKKMRKWIILSILKWLQREIMEPVRDKTSDIFSHPDWSPETSFFIPNISTKFRANSKWPSSSWTHRKTMSCKVDATKLFLFFLSRKLLTAKEEMAHFPHPPHPCNSKR